MDEIEAQI
jgi:hypothetical protein